MGLIIVGGGEIRDLVIVVGSACSFLSIGHGCEWSCLAWITCTVHILLHEELVLRARLPESIADAARLTLRKEASIGLARRYGHLCLVHLEAGTAQWSLLLVW